MGGVDSNLGIGLSMFLRDEFSGPAAKIKASMGSMKKTAEELYDDQLRYTRNLSAGLAMIGTGALVGLGRAIKKGAEFQTQLQFTGIVTNATAKQQRLLGDTAQALATKYMFSSDQIMAGMKEMGKAGMGVDETLTNITAAIKLAGSTDTDLSTTTDTMISVMKQWRIEFTKSAHVADMLSYAVNASVIDMPDLAESMKYAGSTALDMGVGIEEVTAMVMALGQAGMKGSMAGVAVENALRYMGRAIGKYGTGQQKKALQELGISLSDVADSAGNMRPMVEILDVLKNKMVDVYSEEGGGIEKQSALAAIFGVRGKRSASLLLRNLDQYKQFLLDINTQSPGFAGSTTVKMMEKLGNQLKTLSAAWKNVGQNFAEAIEPIANVVIGLLKVIGNVLSALFKFPIVGRMIAAGALGFIIVKTAAFAYKAVVSGIVLMQRQMTGAMTVLSTSSIIGWARMTDAAKTYHMAAGTAGLASAVAAGRVSGVRVNKAGRFVSTKGIGSFVSTAAVGAAAGGLATKVGTGVMGRIVGMLGGPLGIALSFIIPGLLSVIIGAINKGSKATEDNTNALTGNNGNIVGGPNNNQRFIQAIEFVGANKNRIPSMAELSVTGSQRQAMSGEYIKTLEDLIGQMANGGPEGTTIILNVDSEKVFSKTIKAISRKPFLINQ
jgi:TP901 family phage tail tape measure protein